MIERLIISNPWSALIVGVLAYGVGYYLGLYEAYLYHIGAKSYLVLEGDYELTPALQAAIFKRRWVNGRFLAVVFFLTVGILAMWQITIRQYNRPDVLTFLMGGLVLYEAAAGIQHLRNIVLFYYAPKSANLQGKITYSKRLVHTLSFYEMYGFVALYLIMFLVSATWFYLGGALTCFVAGRRHRDWAMIRT